MEIICGIVLVCVIGYVLRIANKPMCIRTEDGRLLEVTEHGSLRHVMTDEQTKEALRKERQEFFDNFEIADGKLIDKRSGKEVIFD